MDEGALTRLWSTSYPDLDFESAPAGLTYSGPRPELLETLNETATAATILDAETAATILEAPPSPSEQETLPLYGGGPSAGGAPYEVIDELGRGGMGIVYRAQQGCLEREVALKCMRGQQSGEARAKFLAEALVTGQLSHPNIVPVYELGATAGGEPTLAMKLVGGTEWRSRLQESTGTGSRGVDELEEPIRVLLSVCDALAFAHARGIAHLDLKPDNIMVGEFNEVLVMDWGLAVDVRDIEAAKAAPSPAPHKSTLTRPCGTPCYMAPELAEGRGEDLGPWTDVYLLGAILHEIIALRPPHRGSSLVDVLLAAVESAPPQYGPEVPEELQIIARRSLARAPEDRYQTVLEFRSALTDFLSHRESLKISDQADRVLERAEGHGEGASAASQVQVYSDFAEAVAGFRQAELLWDENPAAIAGERRARRGYALRALAYDDLVLAEAQAAKLREEDPELRAAIAERRAEKARAERRSRRFVAGFYSALGALVLGLIGGVVYMSSTNARLRAQRDEIQRKEASVRGRVEDLKSAFNLLIVQVRDELAKVPDPRVRAIRQTLLEDSLRSLEAIQEELRADEGRLSVFVLEGSLQLGVLAAAAGNSALALEYRREAVSIGRGLVAESGDDAELRWRLCKALIALGGHRVTSDGELARGLEHFREARGIARRLCEEEPTRLDFAQSLAEVEDRSALVLKDQGELSEARAMMRASLETRRRVAAARSDDREASQVLGKTLRRAARLARDDGGPEEAAAHCEEAIAIARRLLAAEAINAPYREDLADGLGMKGVLAVDRGRFDEAVAAWEEERLIVQGLVDEDRGNLEYCHDLSDTLTRLANIHQRRGELTRAVELCREAVELLRSLLREDGENAKFQESLAGTWTLLGDLVKFQDQFAEAQACYEQGRDLYRRLSDKDPSNKDLRFRMALAITGVGHCRRAQRATGEALESYLEALELHRALARDEVEGSSYREALVVTLEPIGYCYTALGRQEEAFAVYREALALSQALVEREPDSRRFQLRLTRMLGLVAGIHRRRGELDQALALARRSLEVARAQAADPKDVLAQGRLGTALKLLGELTKIRGDFDEALEYYRGFLDIRRRLAEAEPEKPNVARELSLALYLVGDVHQRRGELDEAGRRYEEVLKLLRALISRFPKSGYFAADLAASLKTMGRFRQERGQLAEALSCYREGIELARRALRQDAKNRFFIRELLGNLKSAGSVCRARGALDEARGFYEESLKTDRRLSESEPTNLSHRLELARSLEGFGLVCQDQGRLEEARSSLEEALSIARDLVKRSPKSLAFRRELSFALRELGGLCRSAGEVKRARALFAEAVANHRGLRKSARTEKELAELEAALASLGPGH